MLCALHTYYPWSLDPLIHVPFQLAFFKHTALAGISEFAELIAHIAISALPGTNLNLSQVEHVRVKCLAQGHNIETARQAVSMAKLHALAIAPRPSLRWFKVVEKLKKINIY